MKSGNMRTPAKFRQVFPCDRKILDSRVCSAIWVNKNINMKTWKTINIPGMNNVSAIQLHGDWGRLSIFNIYNDCEHSETEEHLVEFVNGRREDFTDNDTDYMIWAGDFNRHHPLWDLNSDTHLFTAKAMDMAEQLYDQLNLFDFSMALPKDTPTLQHMRSK